MAKAKMNKNQQELYEAVLKLQSVDECQKFFRDLCTLAELKALSERFQVAKMIEQAIPYRKIAEQTGTSTATITRIAHWLHHGEGGYKLILERIA